MSLRFLLLVAVAALSACATSGPPAVTTSAEPGAKLEAYRTFTFVQGDLSAAGAINDRIVRERLQYMIATHLGKRGYVPAAPGQSADLGVHYVGQAVTATRELMTGYPGVYEYRGGRVDIGGYNTLEYRKGTLIVDLFDREQKRLLWRATISEALTAGYDEENWRKIDRRLGEAFVKLPSRR